MSRLAPNGRFRKSLLVFPCEQCGDEALIACLPGSEPRVATAWADGTLPALYCTSYCRELAQIAVPSRPSITLARSDAPGRDRPYDYEVDG